MRHDGRTAGRGGLGGHHPECLGEDRGHDRDVGERTQVNEMAVLERPGEEHRQALGLALELPALRTEADDHGTAADLAERRDQHLHALVLDQLAEVDDGRASPARNSASRSALFSSGRRSSALPGFGGSRRASASSAASASALLWGRQTSMSTPGGTACTRSSGPQTSSTTLRMCSEPTITAAAPRCCLRAPRRKLGIPAHRVLELGTVREDRVARTRRRADGPAEDQVPGDHEIGGEVLADRAGVRPDPRVELGAAGLLHALHAVALVAVDHEHRQQPADIGAHGRGAAEVVVPGPGLLRENRDVVPRSPPLPRELAREHVRAGAGEQIAVPDEDFHDATSNPMASIISGIVTSVYPSSSFQRQICG